MTPQETRHLEFTPARAAAYTTLFGVKPSAVFPNHQFAGNEPPPLLIDVFAYPLEMKGVGEFVALVTNGMSDLRMADPDGEAPPASLRRELIQYLPRATPEHARRLYQMAWLPHFDGFLLDEQHTVAWEWPAVEGTPWKNALFLRPLLRSHAKFQFQLDEDTVSFLWHVPISDAERAFILEDGVDEFLDRMDQVELPFLFDEANRPLVI